MANYTTTDIRNLVLTGSPGSGKTTLSEAMLQASNTIGRAGRVEDGSTVSDFDDLEKEFGHSIDSAVIHFDHKGAHINLIDTPGSPGFFGKVVSALPAIETQVIMIDASSGIDTAVRKLMAVGRDRTLPQVIVINKIDHGDDSEALLANIQDTFGDVCRPVNLPADGGKAVIDCFNNAEGESDFGNVGSYHTGIVDQVVEVDEALMETYLEQGEVSPEQLHGPFEAALRSGHLVPVMFMSAREDVGVSEFMDFISELCPNPNEGNPRTFIIHEGDEQEEWHATGDADHPVAHVFKVSSDPYVGKLSVFRVHQGTINSSVQPRTNSSRKGLRLNHVFKLQGKDHVEIKDVIAGDIGAVAKIDELSYGDVMHDASISDQMRIKPLPMPKPMFGLAIDAANRNAEVKLGEALAKLLAEDPTLERDRVAATGDLVLRGLGDIHLRVKLRMLKDRYGVDVDTRTPKVAYKETITANAEGHHRHKKQSGGSGQFGEVYLRIEPSVGEEAEATLDGFVFVDDTFGGSVPKQFLPAIEKGVRRVMGEGAIAGYPMYNIKVSVYDGKHHAVDSKEIAFVTAGRRAFIDAVKKAKPVLLEPFVKLHITIPSDLIGDVSSDISGKRGRILGTDMLPGNQSLLEAEAPLSEVMSYTNQLKSITGGTGSYEMEYSHDEQTPSNIQAEVVKAFNPEDEE
ncbi:MAG: elongation factor G [Phycisphaerales bacterium]|nr:elongation factor G [Phycisphaerales bacterium]